MGYETLSTSSATPRTVTPPRAAPIGQSFNDQPKGDPFGAFRINSEQAANVIQMGASAPGYVMERPIAALDTLSGGGAKSAIDQAGDTIRGVPVLGDLLSGGTQVIGNVYEGLNRVTRAPVNAGMANALRNTANLDPHAKVDGLTAWLSGAGGLMGDLTVQQLRETAARRGFTKADIDAMVSGRKGILDFADKNVSDNPLVDLAGSLALDPTNYLTFGVAGAAAKGAVKIIPGAEALLSMSGIQKLATGMHGINEAVGISRVTAKGTVAGMMALRAGSIEGVTLNALSRHLGMMFRGSSDFLSGYRKVAYATTAGQIAAQAVGEQLPDNTPLSTLYEPLYKAAKAMGENKPLSQGGTWNLWAAINFPIRDDLSRMWSETRQYGLGIGVGKATVRTPLLKRMFTAEKDIIAELAPGMSIADGRRYLEGPDGFGSPEAFRDYLVHQTKSFYGANVLPRQNALSEAMLSTAEFSTKAVWIDRHIETAAMPALERGLITGRDLVQHIKDEHTGARSYELNKGTGRLEPKAGAVDEAWDPKEHISRWREWTRRMDELHLRGGFQQIYGVVVGVADGALPKEWLRTGQAILKDVAREDGTIAKADMDRFLDKFPALTVDANDPSNFFARLRHPDSGEVHVDAAIQRLKKLEEDASSLRDYLYDVQQWEARAERIKQKRGRVTNERGEFDPTRAPDIADGGAAVLVPSQRGSVRRALNAPRTYEDVLERRGDEAVKTFEESVVPALDDLGFNVTAATQGVMSTGGQKRTAVAIHISPKDDPATILLTAGLVARHARASHAIAIVSGAEALSANGLTANAAHVRFDFGSLGGDEVDTVLEKLTDRFDGQFEYNDTAGVAHVIVREGQAEAVQLLQRELAAIVGDAKARAIEAPAWVQVVNNDTRGAVRSGRTPAADVNASDIFRTHRTDIRYVNAASAFRTAVDERAGLVGQARPGFPRGPEYARAGSDDLGGNGQPGLTDEIRAADTTGTQGQVLWLAEKDDELANLMPKMGDDLRGLPPEEWAKVGAMEAELRRYDPQYRLKILPQDRNTPVYHAGQGNAIKDMVAVSQAASDLMYQKVWKPAADFQNALFGRVYTKRLAEDAKQLLYGEILAKTAHLTEEERPRIKDIDSFLQTLDAAAQNSAVFGSQLYARGDALPPKTINEIASGVWTGRIVGVPKSKTAHDALRGMPVFRGFSPATLEALGGVGNIHKVLDRTGSRFYRDLRERTRGKGQLGSLIRTTYGMSRVATATPRHYIRTFYHLFRFTLDPRWHVLNRAEADILGYAKYGVSRFNGARSPEAIDNAVRLHGGSIVGGESDLLRDALASGILDARHLEGYIGRAFKKGRVNSTKDVIRLMAEEDPSIVQALQRFGGTPDEWTKGLENMMYEFDRKGVEPTIIDEAKKVFNEQQLNDLAPLITRLYERNNQVFRDAVSTFHGNTNRSNLERIMNSYFLFWPISYQLKATKWMFDVLTKQSVGRKTNFLGVWTLDRMYQQHVERLATDEGYQRMFVDNPALWQFAAMLLPVTPFDMGVSLSRFTRYSLAAGGFIEDKDFTGDPFNSALSLLKMGPLYTFTLAQRVYGQSQDRPKDLVVPIQTAA